MNTVARIGYLNTLPFFHGWPEDRFPLLSGSPVQLASAGAENKILAGPLPVVEAWAMDELFEPLGNLGIGTERESRSVFFLSKKDPENFSGPAGLTPESATSAALLKILMRKKWKGSPVFHPGFLPEDPGRLIIGDSALRVWLDGGSKDFPVMTDLASAWADWKKTGFVFARWVVRKDAPASVKRELLSLLSIRLDENLRDLPALCQTEGKKAEIPPQSLETYLRGFRYRLGPAQIKGEKEFQKEWRESRTPVFN